MSQPDGATPKRRATPVSPWSRERARVAGQQLARFRKLRGWDVKDVVSETERLGHRLPRMTISALESGSRENLSIAELLVLSAALDVSPVELVLPVGAATEYEVMPGVHKPIDEALAWFAGDQGAPAVTASRAHASLLQSWRELWADLQRDVQTNREAGEDVVDPDAIAITAKDLDGILPLLAGLRQAMAARGEVLPPVPRELSGIDGRDGVEIVRRRIKALTGVSVA